ncbi:MAG TPA: DnaA/Hda family protein [Xanthobacteraceae bacterium]|jgi:chromosomal replication initiation ATPase DnaA|nr:DnaA/Hda family protein [Xanthobacteraceae bacterium]
MQTAAPRQLALALPHAESFAREDFLAGPSNEAALNLIERWPDWPDRGLVLIGPEGTGKSHLAAIWARLSGARLVAARALEAMHLPATLVTGALVVEDLAAGGFDEAALFHLLNLVREQAAWLMITTRQAPAALNIRLRDLHSRLTALPAVKLGAPDDALLRAVIVKLFADRQLVVDESVVNYLATHVERSVAAARAAVERLDREALRLKRPVTRALAGELFGDRAPAR